MYHILFTPVGIWAISTHLNYGLQSMTHGQCEMVAQTEGTISTHSRSFRLIQSDALFQKDVKFGLPSRGSM